jgi:methionyl-tRNA formyltransferase
MENKQIKPKIIFMGTPEFGALVLKTLILGGYAPELVITQKDKPVGRKQIITPPMVKIVAKEQGIELIQPDKLNQAKEVLKSLNPDLIITAAYSKIISKEIIDLPKYGCLNVHPSLLPEYRGPSPIQYALLNGNKKTGVSVMLIDEQIDHGPILAQKETEIMEDETAEQLHDRLAEIGGNLLVELIPKWLKGEIKPVVQDESKATYTKIIKREDGEIDWKTSPKDIERKIRAFTPWPGAYTFFEKNGKSVRLKILKASIKEDRLVLETVQPEGKTHMSFSEFLRGNPEFAKNKDVCIHIQS